VAKAIETDAGRIGTEADERRYADRVGMSWLNAGTRGIKKNRAPAFAGTRSCCESIQTLSYGTGVGAGAGEQALSLF
jgi:hypothetical protein